MWLPAPYGQETPPLRQGLLAGEATFWLADIAGDAARPAMAAASPACLAARRSVELFQVTPNHLQQIEVTHCPVTRVELSNATHTATDASIDRVRNDAGYAAGNLAVMSRHANIAEGGSGSPRAQSTIAAERALALAGSLRRSTAARICSPVT